MEILNRKARYDYEIEDTYEAGIVLTGTEIKSIREGKVNIKDSYAIIRNNEIYLLYVQSVKKYHSDYEFSLYGENLVSNDLLKKYISKILKWCKKNYNRMSQIKKIEKLYNQKYYLEHKVEKGIKSRIEVNKINGAKRHQNSKTLVLKYALDLVAQNEKITIKTIKTILDQNNEKLGNTQISIYLRELKNEGLIDE